MLACGRTTCKVVRVLKSGLKALDTREPTRMERNKDSVNTLGPTVPSTPVTGMIIRSMELVSTCGRMVESTMANGKRMTCLVTEFISTMTALPTKDNFLTTKKRVTVIIFGPTVGSTRDTGIVENSTALAYSRIQRKAKKNTEFGSRESVFNGSISSPSMKFQSNDTTTPNFLRKKKVSIAFLPIRHSTLLRASSSK